MQQQQPNQLLSLSFSTYSSSRLTDIAARVVQECRNDESADFNDFYRDADVHCDEFDLDQRFSVRLDKQSKFEEENKHDCDDEDFEFTFNCRESETSPISAADDIFYNGQIKTCYPLFDTDLLLLDHDDDDNNNTVQINSVLNLNNNLEKPRRLSLRKLMKEDCDQLPSCSSSDADELEGLPPGTYCVWKPKTEQESLANRKKSSSTGTSSKRWRFRDLLNRSNSEGKDAFVLFPPSLKSKKNQNKLEKSVSFSHGKFAGVQKTNSEMNVATAARVMKEDEKRRSYLPYKQELFGIFSNVNGLSRNLHPF